MLVPVGRLVLLRSVPKAVLVTAMSFLAMPALLGPVSGPPVVAPGAARLSPGMTERHYAPRAKVVLTDAEVWERHLAAHEGQLSGALILGDPDWAVAHPILLPTRQRRII